MNSVQGEVVDGPGSGPACWRPSSFQLSTVREGSGAQEDQVLNEVGS